MAAGFPLFTDNHVRQQIVLGLRSRGWDVPRAIDVFVESTDDEVLFAYSAEHGRVFVSSDEPAQEIPKRWLREGRAFRGMVCWPQRHHQRLTDGDFIAALEDLARDPLAFAYPIRSSPSPEARASMAAATRVRRSLGPQGRCKDEMTSRG